MVIDCHTQGKGDVVAHAEQLPEADEAVLRVDAELLHAEDENEITVFGHKVKARLRDPDYWLSLASGLSSYNLVLLFTF